MIEAKICPHCGADLAKDQPIIINDFSMLSPLSPLCYKGMPLPLAPAARGVCWTLMKAFPRPVSIDTILNRLDSDAEGNVVDVYLSRIRKALRAIDAPIPFEAERSRRHSGQPRAIVWRLRP